MKCFNCNEEMIYRDDIRGLEHADVNKNTDMKVFIYDGKDTELYTK